MSENLTDPAVEDEPKPKSKKAAAAAADEQPKGMYPSSHGEAADLIAERREAIRLAQKRIEEDQVEVNRLQNEIAVLNSLRQANGQAPL